MKKKKQEPLIPIIVGRELPEIRRLTLREKCDYLSHENMHLHRENVRLREKLNAIRGIVNERQLIPLPNRTLFKDEPKLWPFAKQKKKTKRR